GSRSCGVEPVERAGPPRRHCCASPLPVEHDCEHPSASSSTLIVLKPSVSCLPELRDRECAKGGIVRHQRDTLDQGLRRQQSIERVAVDLGESSRGERVACLYCEVFGEKGREVTLVVPKQGRGLGELSQPMLGGDLPCRRARNE